MRARRLRRLGVLSTATTQPSNLTTESTHTAASLPSTTNASKSTVVAAAALEQHDAQKKKLSPTDAPISTVAGFCRNLSTEGEHKQKHQKLDDDYAARQKNENQLTNNDGSAAKSPRYSTNTTQISTDTDTTTQWNNNTTENTESQMMDTDDEYQIQQQILLNEGIENMDTNDPKPSSSTTTMIINNDNIDKIVEINHNNNDDKCVKECDCNAFDEIEICLSRILNAFWIDHCDGQLFVSETACIYKSMQNSKIKMNYEDIVSSSLIEICTQYLNGDRIEKKDHPNWKVWTAGIHNDMPELFSTFKCDNDRSSSTAAQGEYDLDGTTSAEAITNAKKNSSGNSNNTAEQQTQDTSSCSSPNIMSFTPGDISALYYLIECFLRTENEFQRYSGKENYHELINCIHMAQKHIISHSILLLNQTINVNGASKNFTSRRSPLLQILYDAKLPDDYLRQLITESTKNPEHMNNIFGRLVTNIYMEMLTLVNGTCISPHTLRALNKLLSVTSYAEPNVRPICNLVAKKYNFYPKVFSDMPSREIVKTSFLGPFLSMSVFYEENARILGADPKHELNNTELLQNSGNMQEVTRLNNDNCVKKKLIFIRFFFCFLFL